MADTAGFWWGRHSCLPATEGGKRVSSRRIRRAEADTNVCPTRRGQVRSMPARFIIGRAGTGKTRYIRDQIIAALRADPLGPPIYWILPKQATFQAERELTCGTTDLGGFCRARVVSFDQLGGDILNDCGGIAVPQITALG